MPSPLLDTLLDLAIDVARRGEKATPPVPAPARLVPLLRFTKLGERARATTLQALESDEGFRERVLESADEATVGRAGMLFLERPDGWRERLDQLTAAADEPLLAPSRDLRRLERRLERLEQTAERTRADLADVTRERDDLRVRADELERSRHELHRRIEELEAERADLGVARARAVKELATTKEVMERHIAERKRLETQVADMAAAQLNTTASGGQLSDADVRAEADRLGRLVDELSSAVSELADRATPQRSPSPRRTPLPLPPGLSDQSTEVGEYLLRIPRMLVLVDGYNVTKSAHGDLELERQREWLETSLQSASARYGADFEVVFDGADVEGAPPGPARPGVRVRFSADGVEADDVVIERVGHIGLDRPVTVVSSDGRVRRGAATAGANVLASEQLLALLG